MTKGEALQLRGKLIGLRRDGVHIMGNLQVLRRSLAKDDTGIYTTMQDAIDHQVDCVTDIDQCIQSVEGMI